MTTRAALLLLLVATACARMDGGDDLAPVIEQGVAARPGEWPGVVMVLKEDLTGTCSGVLVDARHVLFAAHCILDHELEQAWERGFKRIEERKKSEIVPLAEQARMQLEEIEKIAAHPPYPARVYLDMASFVDRRQERIEVKSYQLHPRALEGSVELLKRCLRELARTSDHERMKRCTLAFWRHDFALLELATDAKTPPMALLNTRDIDRHLRDGVRLELIGYGNTPLDQVKRIGRARVVNRNCAAHSDCSPGEEFTLRIDDGSRVVQGDSGGPAVIQTLRGPMVAGICSGTPNGADYDVYGRLDQLAGWYEQPGGTPEPPPEPRTPPAPPPRVEPTPHVPAPSPVPTPAPEPPPQPRPRHQPQPQPQMSADQNGGCSAGGEPRSGALLLLVFAAPALARALLAHRIRRN